MFSFKKVNSHLSDSLWFISTKKDPEFDVKQRHFFLKQHSEIEQIENTGVSLFLNHVKNKIKYGKIKPYSHLKITRVLSHPELSCSMLKLKGAECSSTSFRFPNPTSNMDMKIDKSQQPENDLQLFYFIVFELVISHGQVNYIAVHFQFPMLPHSTSRFS